MPRIQAATVPEHRAMRRRELLDAARELLAETGEAPALAAVAERAGMSRPSAYQYFRSKQDLLDAVIEDTFPRWSERVQSAMRAAGDPGRRVLAYVDVNLALVAEGEHAVAKALQAAVAPEVLAERSGQMHAQLRAPLLEALREIGPGDAEVTAELVGAIVYTGSVMVETGTDLDVVRAHVASLLGPYLGTAER